MAAWNLPRERRRSRKRGKETTIAELDLSQVREALNAERRRLEQETYNLTQGSEDPFPVVPESDLNQVKGDQADQAEPLTEFERNREILDQLRALRLRHRSAPPRGDAVGRV